MHRSRLAGFIIDCDTGDVAGAAAFWSAALGDKRLRKPQGKYVKLDDQAGLHAEVQRVDHPPRVHLDIESDDIPAEVARLEKLGARRIANVRTWVVMEAPTGHRFCVIRAQTRDFDAKAHTWED
jgi:glyoxalase superfamily protein